MIDPKNINEIIQNVLESLPPGFKNMPSYLQQNLVTREEFDAQCKVLLRTREKLEALEKKLMRPS